MNQKDSIKQIIDTLPTKVVSPEGRNYYLTLKIMPEEITHTTLKTYYYHPSSKHKVAETLFDIESKDVSATINRVVRELTKGRYATLNPIPDKVFRTSRPLMPGGDE